MKFRYNGKDFFEVTSDYLSNEPFRNGSKHLGIDLNMDVGTPLYSPVEGVIQKIADYGNESLGKAIYIKTEDNETVILGHLDKISVDKGEIISIKDKLGESGNTGNVIGDGHLHIGLKDESGKFIDPIDIEGKFQRVSKDILGDEKGGILQYLHDLREEGFFMATFEKTPYEFFFGWLGDALKTGLHFILENNEAFIIIPAIGIMFVTFLIGKNKYTKWIAPLWLAYFATNLITETTGLMKWLEK